MGWLGTVACVLACWLAAGCDYAATAAETGAFACTNTVDEDGDGKTDCDDPDCWGYARCRVPPDASLPLGTAEPGPPFEQPNDMGMNTWPIVDASIPVETPDAEAAPDSVAPPETH